MLANFQKIRMLRGIEASEPARSPNPYRQILRRHVPEPLLALLIFVMGVWLWDNHVGATEGYELGTCRMALLKHDRDLRLAEATEDLPPLLRSALSIPGREEALAGAVAALEALAAESALDEEGKYALAILDPLRRGEDPADGPFLRLGLPGPPQLREVVRRIAEGRDAWWDREYLKRTGRLSPSQVALHAGTEEDDPRNRELALRAITARSAVGLLVLVGVGFLPHAFRCYARALRATPAGYPGAWPTGLGLGVFLMAYLASIGFGKAIDLLISGDLSGEAAEPLVLHSSLFVLVDAATRFLPPLVALALLFRRGRHAVGRLGLVARPDGGLILGTFALLTGIDQLLRRGIGADLPPDPTGGLSPMEAGPWGLILALSSACIAAPIAEEILYRGVLFRSLANRLRVPAATLLSAALFAVVHFYNAYGLLSVGVFGAACALCFAANGRLASAIVLHSLYNSAIKIPEWIVYHAPL
jgi:membrane protease YdiL (CAAX protease family)